MIRQVWRGRRRSAYIAAAAVLVPGAARRSNPGGAALSKAIATDEEETAAHLLFARPATFMLSVAELGLLPKATCRRSLSPAARSRQVEPDQRAGRPGSPGADLEHARPDAADQFLRPRRPAPSRRPAGYGYAQAPLKLVEEWQKLVFAYLRGRPNLMRALVLVDARHGLKTSDEAVMAMLGEAAVPFQLVLTKVDLVRPAATAELTGELVARLRRVRAALPTVLATSARSREGLDELQGRARGACRPTIARGS